MEFYVLKMLTVISVIVIETIKICSGNIIYFLFIE